MALKATVETLDSVPEAVRDMYAERDGKFHLTVEGMVPKGRLDEFRSNNLTLKQQIEELTARYDGIDPDNHRELAAQALKIKEKKLIEAGKLDELVAERVAAMRADSDKQIKTLTDDRSRAQAQLEKLLIDNAIHEAATKVGVRSTAVEDVLRRGRETFKLQDGKAIAMDGDKPVYGKDGEPMPVAEWVHGLAARAPHLFDPTTGGKAPASHTGAGGAKTMTRTQFDAIPLRDQAATIRSGVTITD